MEVRCAESTETGQIVRRNGYTRSSDELEGLTIITGVEEDANCGVGGREGKTSSRTEARRVVSAGKCFERSSWDNKILNLSNSCTSNNIAIMISKYRAMCGSTEPDLKGFCVGCVNSIFSTSICAPVNSKFLS